MQAHLALLSDGCQPHTPVLQKDDLSRFLSSLSTAWRQGEVRATHAKLSKPPRYWRTRSNPFEGAWPTIQSWLEANPDQTGRDLFRRLQRECPGDYPEGQLRSLQHRLKEWRGQMARKLILGVHHQALDLPVNSGGSKTSAADAANCPTP